VRIEDMDTAELKAENSEQATDRLLDVLEDVNEYPNLGVYHGLNFMFQSYHFELDPEGWIFVIDEHGPRQTGRQVSKSAIEQRRQQWFRDQRTV
jgi:hypothetical protein